VVFSKRRKEKMHTKFLAEKSEGNRTLGIRWLISMDNIKMNLKGMG
jgi:hypothetical protein